MLNITNDGNYATFGSVKTSIICIFDIIKKKNMQ